VYGDGRSRRPAIAKEFAVDLVVSLEVFHVSEEAADLNNVTEIGTEAPQDIPDVFDDSTGLRSNVPPHLTITRNFHSGKGIVRAA
jgi:hypothetical protein